ncbi:MAG: hypothetical protein ACFFAH_08370 [Promethearchaeota archaeon]
MEVISKLLNLSDDAISIYLNCLGKNPLTSKEIHTFKPDLSDAEFKVIIDDLINKKLLLNKTPKNSQLLSHYLAIPPFFIINKMTTQIKNDLLSKESYITKQKDASKVEDREISVEFLKKHEDELKNLVTSELAAIVITLLQLKSELQEKIKAVGIKDSQWDVLKNDIKDILALETHIKAKDINEIISIKFKEISDIIKTKIVNFQKDTSQNQIDSENLLSNVQFIEDFLKIILDDYTEINFFIFDKFWPVNSKGKICEEISNLLMSSKEKALIIVPELKEYISLEQLNNFSANLKLTLISSESHKNPLIKEISKMNNVEYLRLKNNEFIGLKREESYIVIGIFQENEEKHLNNVIGFGTTYIPLIEQINPIILEKLNEAKPTKEKQITNGFNYIIQNINILKGRKISKILQEVLDVGLKIEGMSLNILEIKLLISKLKAINQPLDKDMKKIIIAKITELNEKFSNLHLVISPDLKDQSLPKTKILEEVSKVDIESINSEQFESLFNFFLEKFDELNGITISKQIENLIELSLKFQGYSTIIDWKNELKSIKNILEEPFRKKIKEDFKKWKDYLLKPKINEIFIQKQVSEKSIREPKAQIQIEEIIEEEYYSPALAELSETTDDNIFEIETDKKTIDDIFNEIFQNLNNFTGLEISKEMQNIIDIILETVGYSMDLKDMKQWNSKLRKIKNPLDDDIKNLFLTQFNKWMNKYSNKKFEAKVIEYSPTFAMAEEYTKDSDEEQSKDIKEKFNDLIQSVNTLEGVEISKKFQDIVDILLETQGYSMALKDMRQWISKLRAIRTTLEDEFKIQLLNELGKWKDQFS